MLSSAYQQTTATNKTYEQIDPENRLLWRANIRRLDFEAVRDSLLFVSGRLDTTLGGKPVNLTEEPYSYRRSVYGFIDRGNLPELMSHFDFSDPDMPNSKRTTTVVPQQALFLMNSSMSVDVARKLVVRPEFLAAYDDRARVQASTRCFSNGLRVLRSSRWRTTSSWHPRKRHRCFRQKPRSGGETRSSPPASRRAETIAWAIAPFATKASWWIANL